MHKAVLLNVTLRSPGTITSLLKDQFFLPGVKSGLRVESVNHAEYLRFFAGSPYEQAFAIVKVPEGASQDAAFTQAERAVKAHIADGSLDRNDARYVMWASGDEAAAIGDISQFLRDNKTLDGSRYRSCNGKRCIADAEGFGVLSATDIRPEHFDRVVRTYALAVAYGEVLSQISQKASKVVLGKADQAESAMRSLTEFMVAHYFDHPISTRTRELLDFYAVARDQLRLVEQSQETSAQLNLLSQVVRESRRDAELRQRESDRELQRKADLARQEQNRLEAARQAALKEQLDRQQESQRKTDTRIQFCIAILGLAVTATSLVQFTPKSIGSFTHAWHDVFVPASSAVNPPQVANVVLPPVNQDKTQQANLKHSSQRGDKARKKSRTENSTSNPYTGEGS